MRFAHRRLRQLTYTGAALHMQPSICITHPSLVLQPQIMESVSHFAGVRRRCGSGPYLLIIGTCRMVDQRRRVVISVRARPPRSLWRMARMTAARAPASP